MASSWMWREVLTQPSGLQGWSNLFMSTAKEALDLGHQTAGNRIHRSKTEKLRNVIHSQYPGGKERKEGCISVTLSHLG